MFRKLQSEGYPGAKKAMNTWLRAEFTSRDGVREVNNGGAVAFKGFVESTDKVRASGIARLNCHQTRSAAQPPPNLTNLTAT